MLSISVIHVGDCKEDCLIQSEREYCKRLKAFCDYNLIAIKDERLPENEDNAALIEKALKTEAVRIRQKIPKRCYKIALCVEGRGLSSEGFADLLNKTQQEHCDVVFIIGSSHGIDGRLKTECDYLLSLSEMTFPHQMIRPILAEQIYRAFTIITGRKYHK
ncbi:MAG: 23S rRNA (pseudouridine(1915)-N(3))-methyltransferase RlmH [Eubacteriales bacterium]|nr:23S rRNA (pseudouridine(1915)-N(3))-methyltransferase RlmH [Eubacteriales bacterium]MDD4421609.1 23S rRNA (pseudouridine(1915)-N(3))-methyltransferase RlmH [Eubacteriales bacterium]HBR32615.1 23S rRNA (pseudouridine(1915)-N(3))-methyltransferase RlmH [Clostridiales bacterium]